ncbi:QueT transporter family protein [Thermoanaerobacterium thermosaccharolyticum]|uniref:QueT transporter family protein n=1 Tax=Thermoanaerobacterium thermosaccharolyticum TaxID=1517 RepID=UPI00105086CF|nr:QueT transporter family protein [Thermoanaerobacterium thermosaccharolyticum]MBE0067937.1 QueT transporter family protein [Thermoanaerobacterium thermosaccharolyticum]MBE0227676.1 QueT transporter family protein [Thermoanaerobacterium thermosaccharolyticum]TCW42271.1 putative membrane protein [Thermohydrogenium kirishiense]
MNKKTKKIVYGALIAALYAVMTIALAPISYGQIQVRVAEALTVLPFFSSYSILGLFVGCIIANMVGGNGVFDIVFGSLATLISAVITYYIGKSNLKYKRYLAPLPPVLINAVIIGIELNVVFKLPLVASMLWVGLGEMVACYVLGLPLLLYIDKNEKIKEMLG